MKKLIIILALLSALIVPKYALAVESATATMFKAGEFTVVSIVWVSAADGTCSYAFAANILKDIRGKSAYMAVTDPGATAPTANYDIVLNDELSADIFGGSLANRHTTSSEQAVPTIGAGTGDRPVTKSVQMEITNAGDTKGGTLAVLFH